MNQEITFNIKSHFLTMQQLASSSLETHVILTTKTVDYLSKLHALKKYYTIFIHDDIYTALIVIGDIFTKNTLKDKRIIELTKDKIILELTKEFKKFKNLVRKNLYKEINSLELRMIMHKLNPNENSFTDRDFDRLNGLIDVVGKGFAQEFYRSSTRIVGLLGELILEKK